MKHLSANNSIYAMDANNPPAATVKPGEIVSFETKDCFSNQIQKESHLFESADWATINPATGPLFVEGAAWGDTLKVDILDIEVCKQGSMVAVPEMGAMGHKIKKSETKIIPVQNGYAIFNNKIKMPIKPMIGVIGTAPLAGSIPNGTPDKHGGNMDTKHIRKGSSLYLPVFHPGALLAIGDLHALMGDGEVVVTGLEIAGTVTVKVSVIKGITLGTPFLETEDSFYVIASDKTLDQAAKFTLDKTFAFLKDRLPLSTNEICMLMSLIGDLQISQIVDPLITCRMALSKAAFAHYNLAFDNI